jgi:hypothetical protein
VLSVIISILDEVTLSTTEGTEKHETMDPFTYLCLSHYTIGLTPPGPILRNDLLFSLNTIHSCSKYICIIIYGINFSMNLLLQCRTTIIRCDDEHDEQLSWRDMRQLVHQRHNLIVTPEKLVTVFIAQSWPQSRIVGHRRNEWRFYSKILQDFWHCIQCLVYVYFLLFIHLLVNN